MNMLETLQNLLNDSGFVSFFADGGWKNLARAIKENPLWGQGLGCVPKT